VSCPVNAAGTARALVGEAPTGTARATLAASVPVESRSVLEETLGTLVPIVRLPADEAFLRAAIVAVLKERSG
jgi:hypothetical protein